MPSFVHRLTTPKSIIGVNVVVATLRLPAGQYIVTAKGSLTASNTPLQEVCEARLVVGTQQDSVIRKLFGPGEADQHQEIHLVVGAKLATATDAQLICTMAAGRGFAQAVVITANLVETLTTSEAVGDPPPPPPPDTD
jgi:hypothetical protein